jgi:hypothetical protein
MIWLHVALSMYKVVRADVPHMSVNLTYVELKLGANWYIEFNMTFQHSVHTEFRLFITI